MKEPPLFRYEGREVMLGHKEIHIGNGKSMHELYKALVPLSARYRANQAASASQNTPAAT